MHSNVIKFNKLDLIHEIESNSISFSQKQSINRIILNKLTVILGHDTNKALKMVEQLISKEEMTNFKSELETQILSTQKVDYKALSKQKHLSSLRSCFEGVSADSIL